MRYLHIEEGIFLERPNRFIAKVLIAGHEETVHVKNTGRCRELLVRGAKIRLERSDDPKRKTRYDLVMVYKDTLGWVNIDSQAPNKAAAEWFEGQFDYIKPEYTFGESRVDFYMEKDGEKYLVEVKGCTLEREGIGYFPDAPTERGTKHLRELTKAADMGYRCAIAFVIQMEGILQVLPNTKTDPDFAEALQTAQNSGVEVWYLQCRVGENDLEVIGKT